MVDLFTGFREKRPRKITTVRVRAPRAAVCIGYLEAVSYRTTHGNKSTLYTHEFASGSRPLFCASADGKQLLLLGGRFRFTKRGVVDRDSKGREILDPEHGQPLDDDT